MVAILGKILNVRQLVNQKVSWIPEHKGYVFSRLSESIWQHDVKETFAFIH